MKVCAASRLMWLVLALTVASASAVEVTLKEGTAIRQGDRVLHTATVGDSFVAERFRAGWVYGAYTREGQIIRGWVRREDILEPEKLKELEAAYQRELKDGRAESARRLATQSVVLARTSSDEKELQAALDRVAPTIELSPGLPELHYARGVLNVALKRYTLAYQDFTAALRLDDRYVEA